METIHKRRQVDGWSRVLGEQLHPVFISNINALMFKLFEVNYLNVPWSTVF